MRLLLLLAGCLMFLTGSAIAADFGFEGRLTDCRDDTDKTCMFERNTLLEQWPKALAGHYPSQRNIAFCLADGCYGAVSVDPVMSCAWRIVILASGAKDIEKSDHDNYMLGCRMALSTAEQAEAKKTAWDLFYAIYGRVPQ